MSQNGEDTAQAEITSLEGMTPEQIEELIDSFDPQGSFDTPLSVVAESSEPAVAEERAEARSSGDDVTEEQQEAAETPVEAESTEGQATESEETEEVVENESDLRVERLELELSELRRAVGSATGEAGFLKNRVKQLEQENEQLRANPPTADYLDDERPQQSTQAPPQQAAPLTEMRQQMAMQYGAQQWQGGLSADDVELIKANAEEFQKDAVAESGRIQFDRSSEESIAWASGEAYTRALTNLKRRDLDRRTKASKEMRIKADSAGRLREQKRAAEVSSSDRPAASTSAPVDFSKLTKEQQLDMIVKQSEAEGLF